MRKTCPYNGVKTFILLWLIAAFGANAQKLFLSSVAPAGNSFFDMPATDTTALFAASGGNRHITIQTNLRPSAISTEKWCTATFTTSGLELQTETNTSTGTRSCMVHLYGKDNLDRTLTIRQLGSAPGIITKEKYIGLKNNARTFTVDLLSNATVTATLPEWITLKEQKTVDGIERYIFSADEMEKTGTRENTILFTLQSGETATVDVRQEFAGYPRFAVISDMHFGNNEGEGPQVKVPQALKHLLSKPGLDALFICGDLTDGGTSAQYDQLRTVFSDPTIVPADLPVYFLMGDHDNYDADGQTNFATLGQPLFDFIDIKGYPFIKLGMKGSRGYDGYSDEERNYLEKALSEASRDYPGKPIFVFTHVPAYGTVYGSCAGEGGWGSRILCDILEKYPQIVMFSGHSHFPLGDPRSIHQGIFTSVNLGSTTYSEIEPGLADEGIHPEDYAYVTEGVIVEADRNTNLTIERWDTYNDEEMLPRWQVSAPHDGTKFSYINRNGGKAPWFDTDAAVVISDVTEKSCTVTFPRATDDEIVHHYIIDITDEQNNIIGSVTRFSCFYLNSRMPLSYTVEFNGVPSGATLTARVKAVDSYENTSPSLNSDPFKTPSYEPAPDVVAPVPALIDLTWDADGQATDISPSGNTVKTGTMAPNIEYDEHHGRHIPHFKGNANCFYRIDYVNHPQIKTAFQQGFSFEVIYTPDNTDNVCIMSAQENGCAGIEQGSGGQIQFYAYVGGRYRILKSSVTAVPGHDYHVIATYDADKEETCIYINGQPAGSMEAPGTLTFPSNEQAHWIAIGGDAGVNGYIQYPLAGKIALARMYDKAVSRDEAYRMYEREYQAND